MKGPLTFFQKVRQRLKWISNDIASALRLPDLKYGTGLDIQGRLRDIQLKPYDYRILIYHGIDMSGNLLYNSRFISQNYFERQISFFKENYNLVSLSSVFNGDLKRDQLNVAITFDDGYANNLKYALPVLDQYVVPATFFITTIQEESESFLWTDFLDIATFYYSKPIDVDGERFVKRRNHYLSKTTGKTLKSQCKERDLAYKLKTMKAFPESLDITALAEEDHYRLLNPEEIRKLAAHPLMTIGTHGKFHNCLGLISKESAYTELASSKLYLENLVQKEIDAVAYPDGSYSRSIISQAEAMGYSYQLAVDYLFEEDAVDFRIRDRFGINPYISWNNQILSILKGSYL